MASLQSVLQRLKLKYNKSYNAPSVPLEKLRAMQEEAAERMPLSRQYAVTQSSIAAG